MHEHSFSSAHIALIHKLDLYIVNVIYIYMLLMIIVFMHI